jgi:N-acetylneuraminic acid mutarotase
MNRIKSTVVVLVILSLILTAFSLPLVWGIEDSWARERPIPTIRSRLGVVAVNGKIYVIGGINDSGYLSINEEYDPITKTWTTKTSMPTPRSDFGIAVVNNKIYCIGGIIKYDWSGYGEGTLCAANEVYDPLTDTWKNKTEMPTTRQRPIANVVDDKIYIIGGFQYQDLPPPHTTIQLDVNEVYDPKTDAWTTKKPIPFTTSNPSSATIDNKIYVIGGFQKNLNQMGNLNQIYNPQSDTWSQGAPIPTAIALAGAGATTGEMAPKCIYVIGGYTSYDEVSLNQVYNPQTDTWTSGQSIPTARHGFGVAVVNDTLYCIGGGSTNLNVRYYDENEKYLPIGYIPEFPSWAPLLIMIIVVVVISITYRLSLSKPSERGGNH